MNNAAGARRKSCSDHLRKDLVRDIKRGHMWVYSDAIDRVKAAPGTVAILVDKRGERLASGIYSADHAIPLRIFRTAPPLALNDAWLTDKLTQAYELRSSFFDSQTTGYRLTAGEGDLVRDWSLMYTIARRL